MKPTTDVPEHWVDMAADALWEGTSKPPYGLEYARTALAPVLADIRSQILSLPSHVWVDSTAGWRAVTLHRLLDLLDTGTVSSHPAVPRDGGTPVPAPPDESRPTTPHACFACGTTNEACLEGIAERRRCCCDVCYSDDTHGYEDSPWIDGWPVQEHGPAVWRTPPKNLPELLAEIAETARADEREKIARAIEAAKLDSSGLSGGDLTIDGNWQPLTRTRHHDHDAIRDLDAEIARNGGEGK